MQSHGHGRRELVGELEAEDSNGLHHATAASVCWRRPILPAMALK